MPSHVWSRIIHNYDATAALPQLIIYYLIDLQNRDAMALYKYIKSQAIQCDATAMIP